MGGFEWFFEREVMVFNTGCLFVSLVGENTKGGNLLAIMNSIKRKLFLATVYGNFVYYLLFFFKIIGAFMFPRIMNHFMFLFNPIAMLVIGFILFISFAYTHKMIKNRGLRIFSPLILSILFGITTIFYLLLVIMKDGFKFN